MNTRQSDADLSPLPMPIPIMEARHVNTDTEADIGESIHDAALQTVAIEEAFDKVVTLEIKGNLGLGFHAYELDLSPSGADELALWLIRRAEAARAEIRTARWKKRRQHDDQNHPSSADSFAGAKKGHDNE